MERSALTKRRSGESNGLVMHGVPGAVLSDALLNAYGNTQQSAGVPRRQKT